MDIYFCDLCGVRVTDVDLRSGHGIRSHADVICGTCLELGHGKDWLSQRTKPKAAVASPTLDAARDRVATLEEEAPPPVVGRPVLPEVREQTPTGAHPVLSEIDLTSTAKLATPRADGIPLASAANLFSALGQVPKRASSTPDTATPVVSDDDDDLLDAPLSEDTSPAGGSVAIAIADDDASPFPYGDEVTKQEAEQEDTAYGIPTLPSSGDDQAGAREGAPGAKKRTGTSSRHKRAGTTSRIAKAPAKSKGSSKITTRRRSSAKDPTRMIMVGSMISLLLMSGIFGIIYYNKRNARTPGIERRGMDETAIKALITETKPIVVAALQAEDLGQCQQAKAKLESVQQSVNQFEEKALRDGHDEKTIGYYLNKSGWNDLYAMKRNLNDMIQRLSH